MSNIDTVEFIESPDAEDKYLAITVNTARVLESWREAVYSFEWLELNDAIKSMESLSEIEQKKRRAVEEKLAGGQPLEKPILGIGVMDNVEIGAGRAVFLTLCDHGAKTLPVYIPKSCESDFKDFLAGV